MSRSVFIFGETGRMGQEVKNIIKCTEGLSFAGGYSAEDPNAELLTSPDIIIDFSLPEALETLCDFVGKHKSAVVSGTTGWSVEQKQRFQNLGSLAPVFWSANMSFGVYLMCRLTETLAKYENFYDFDMEETHHVYKKDKPSGTALIVEEAARKNTSKLKPIVSFREGEVFGIHSFKAKSKNEELEIKHTAHNRTLFAQGAVDISQWVKEQPPGYYGMDDFFKNFQDSSGVEDV